ARLTPNSASMYGITSIPTRKRSGNSTPKRRPFNPRALDYYPPNGTRGKLRHRPEIARFARDCLWRCAKANGLLLFPLCQLRERVVDGNRVRLPKPARIHHQTVNCHRTQEIIRFDAAVARHLHRSWGPRGCAKFYKGAFNPLPVKLTTIVSCSGIVGKTFSNTAIAVALVGSTKMPCRANFKRAARISSSLAATAAPCVSRTIRNNSAPCTGWLLAMPSAMVTAGSTRTGSAAPRSYANATGATRAA